MSIIIGADIVPTKSNREIFVRGEVEQLTGNELYRILMEADYRIFNLEVPLVDCLNPIEKQGPNLVAPTKSVNGLYALGIDLLTLANNHIMDQGIQGLESTIKTLNQAKILHVGTGNTLQEAVVPLFFIANGIKYGIYTCAEHEFSIADKDKPGANPFDPFESPDHVAKMKTQCDYAIVLYHGGKEYYRYPSPNLQKTCRKLVEKGADLVICQHSHCIGCEEQYLAGTIVYGQGNFLFDHGDKEYQNTSLLVSIKDDGKIEYVPIKKRGSGVRLAVGNEGKQILAAFKNRSREIMNPDFVEKKYAAFAEKTINGYMLSFSGMGSNYLFRAMNKLSGYRLQNRVAFRYRKKMRTQIQNYIECEAHREIILKGLKNKEQ